MDWLVEVQLLIPLLSWVFMLNEEKASIVTV